MEKLLERAIVQVSLSMGKLDDRCCWIGVEDRSMCEEEARTRAILVRATGIKVVHNSRLNPRRDYGYVETGGRLATPVAVLPTIDRQLLTFILPSRGFLRVSSSLNGNSMQNAIVRSARDSD